MSGTVTDTQPVTIVSPSPSSLDNLFVNLAPVPNTGWSTQEPVFPTVWPPPPPLPTQSLAWAGQIPWRKWIENMAVRPYVTDPPPCPVVVSRYPGLTNN